MFFEPKNGTEGSQEEDAFNSHERNHAFHKAGSGSITPFESPLHLALDARHHFNRTEQVILLAWILDVRVDEKQVRFAVDILGCNLKAIETAGFGQCHFRGKVAAKVFIDNDV